MKTIFTGHWLNPVYPGALWPSKSHQVELEMRLQKASFPGESPTEQFPFATFQVSRAAPVGKCEGPLQLQFSTWCRYTGQCATAVS